MVAFGGAACDRVIPWYLKINLQLTVSILAHTDSTNPTVQETPQVTFVVSRYIYFLFPLRFTLLYLPRGNHLLNSQVVAELGIESSSIPLKDEP